MTTQPDRQDGDATRSREIAAAMTVAARNHAISITADDIGILARVVPARDAAEGAEMIDQIRTIKATCINLRESEATRLGVISERCDDILSASPKPAPDAMREALKIAIGHIDHMAAFITKANSDYHCGVYSFESLGEDMPGIRAALSAPVPPTDGALGRAWEALARLRAMTPTEFKAYHSCVDLFEAALRALSPPGTGAAEPVAWRWRYKNGPEVWNFSSDHVVEEAQPPILLIEPLYATPSRQGTPGSNLSRQAPHSSSEGGR